VDAVWERHARKWMLGESGVDRCGKGIIDAKRLFNVKRTDDAEINPPGGTPPYQMIFCCRRHCSGQPAHIMFASATMLQLLLRAPQRYIDATFKVVTRSSNCWLCFRSYAKILQALLLSVIMSSRRKRDYMWRLLINMTSYWLYPDSHVHHAWN
jgi:hypothetical protein